MSEQEAVLVTGAGRGLGATIAERLAATGYAVLVTDIDADTAELVAQRIRDDGGEAHALRLDVTSEQSCEEAVRYADERLGGLYGVVNNAGIVAATPFVDMTVEQWDAVLTVNARGTFLVCRAAARAMRPRGRGAIVNIASIAGRDGFPKFANYVASKHAVIGLTRTLARELGPDGIRANAVCPGAIKTAMWSAEAQDTDDPDAVFDSIAEGTSLRRNQTSDDIADAVEFLIGPRANSITGQSLIVDSGLIFA
ncbi:SDR family NAD(P)-dependent oxidoreductase [Conexibacter sp. CPCC 206217]|uniref:SDR family NAD(P)-dependent oxidoreductase n=1 Tax=Conexibacter sp. CPCC 206217 TaxID=3064574 RepID=UPI00271F3A41|nr:SDR family NAD(P)-dependent oxidoreductase [Conexibacter sp. CPCC 206217]MDO8209604.1 SDR family NAD(P)-dependent oxidoreductase [Conexibacter sp. CPCC 206217]